MPLMGAPPADVPVPALEVERPRSGCPMVGLWREPVPWAASSLGGALWSSLFSQNTSPAGSGSQLCDLI